MDKKQNQIIQVARRLFSRYGLKRVTVEEICREAGVSKMTYYKHFKNKVELARYVFEEIFAEGEQQFEAVLKADISFPEKVKEIIHLKEEQTQKYSQEFLNDWIFINDPELKKLLENKTAEFRQRIIDFFEQARKKGEIAQDINLNFVLYMMRHLSEILKDEQLLAIYPDKSQAIMEIVKYFFYGLLPRE